MTADASTTLATAKESIDFNGSALDLDGTVSTYKWDFGDGTTATTKDAAHAFDHQGTYYVTLNVTDNGGATADTMFGGSPLQITVLPGFKAPDPEDQPLAMLTLWSASSAIRPGGSVSWSATSSRGSWNFEAASPPALTTYEMNYGEGAAVTKTEAERTAGTWDGNFTHMYANAGKFAATLKVTNAAGKTDMTYWDVLVVAVNPTPGVKNKDILTIMSFGQPQYLDPAIAYDDASNAVVQAVYETLITYQGEKADTFVPLLAKEVPTEGNGLITNGGMRYTFNLQQGVRFHNGETMKASDVVFSFKRVLEMDDPDSAVWIYSSFLNSSGITATGEYQVQFDLTTPYGAFVSTLAYPTVSIVSKKFVDDHGGLVPGERNQYMLTHMSGTGPFVFRSWTTGTSLLIDKNHDYWNPAGAAKMEHVAWQYVTEFSTRLGNLKAGDADIISVVSADLPEMTAVAQDASNLIKIDSGAPTWDISTGMFNQNINVSARSEFGTVPYPDNVPSDFFTDVNMRKAFSLAYDRDAYIENVAHGLGFELKGVIPKGMYGYNPNLNVAQYDIEGAKAAYNQTKWVTNSTYNPGGYAGGFNLTIAYNCGNTNREQYALIMKGTPAHPGVEQLGPNIHINAICIEWATYLGLISVAQGHVPGLATWIVGWGPDYADPDDYVRPFLETGNYFPARTQLSYPAMDAEIAQAAAMPNSPARQALYDSIQTFAVENYLYIYNVQALLLHVAKTWVHGWYANPMWSGKELGGNLAAIWKE